MANQPTLIDRICGAISGFRNGRASAEAERERAKTALREAEAGIARIASACGLSDTEED